MVDDGSTDATAQIFRRFPGRLLSRDRLGLSRARNVGLGQAEGELVAHVHADARADADWFTYLALALEVPGTAARTPSPQTTHRWPSAWRVRLGDRSTCSSTTRGPSTWHAGTWRFGASGSWR